MAKKKMDLVEKYFRKLFHMTAVLAKTNIAFVEEQPRKSKIVFAEDVGNHADYVFEGDKYACITSSESPFMKIYQDMSGKLMYSIPNHLMLDPFAVQNALKKYFGVVWEITLPEYLDSQMDWKFEHWPGFHRYTMYQMYIHDCKFDRKNGFKSHA